MDYGTKIRVLRAFWHWSQDELARRIGEKRVTITYIERGNLIPNTELEARLRRALGWTERVDALLDELAAELERGRQEAA